MTSFEKLLDLGTALTLFYWFFGPEDKFTDRAIILAWIAVFLIILLKK